MSQVIHFLLLCLTNAIAYKTWAQFKSAFKKAPFSRFTLILSNPVHGIYGFRASDLNFQLDGQVLVLCCFLFLKSDIFNVVGK